jgi:N6-adenosine-specific RNA methylase IME4
MPVSDKSERNFIIAPLRENGRKPDEQYRKIEALYPTEKYPNRVELYARQQWPGWIALGDRIDGLDLAESIPLLASGDYQIKKRALEWRA